MTTVVSAHGVRKRFGRTAALDGLGLEILAGEVHGFLGPDGAGKTRHCGFRLVSCESMQRPVVLPLEPPEGRTGGSPGVGR